MFRSLRIAAAAIFASAILACPSGENGGTPSPPTLTGSWAGVTSGTLTDSVVLLLTDVVGGVTGSALYQRRGAPADTGSVSGSLVGTQFTGTLTFGASVCTFTMTATGTLDASHQPMTLALQLSWSGSNQCTTEIGVPITLTEIISGPPAAVASVSVTPTQADLALGQSLQLVATAHDGAGRALLGHVFAWQSASTPQLPVSATGIVTALAVSGPIVITVTSAGKSATATITGVNAVFDHSTTAFPLSASHAVPPLVCTSCHANGAVSGIGMSCLPCHQATYDTTSNPPHAAAALPPTCWGCHQNGTWANASIVHIWFRLDHFAATCAQCHTTDYTTFSCRGCHGDTHTKGYSDSNCYGCHVS